MDEAYRKARQIVESHNEQINAMADLLMEKETIYADDIESILGRSAQSLKAEMRKQSEESSAEQGDVVSPVAEE